MDTLIFLLKNGINYLDSVNWEIISGIILSVILGFILGLERELTNKWAGLRTHILVCLGSCVFTTLSIYGFPLYTDPINFSGTRYGDPSRIAAQVLTGIGFIGGGTVLRHGSSIYGLTTAATLWIAASIGMACACGMHKLALLTTFLSVAILVIIRIFEKKVIRQKAQIYKKVEISVCVANEYADEIYSSIMQKLNNILELNKKKSTKNENLTKIFLIVELKERTPINYIYQQFSDIKNIESISVKELYD